MRTIEEVREFVIKEIPIREEVKNQLFRGNDAWNHHDSVLYAYKAILDFIDSEVNIKCTVCKTDCNETPVRFDNEYYCNEHIPDEYFDPRHANRGN